MRKIYKYALPSESYFGIGLPQGAEILKADVQHGTPWMWAIVDPEKPPEMRIFRLIGTGHSIGEDGLKFISTFQMSGGDLVFHFFERMNVG